VSRNWSGLSARERSGAAAVFEAIEALDALSESMAPETDRGKVGFRQLVAWINGPSVALPVSVKATLLVDPSLRRDFQRLLEHAALFRCERAAAASSGDLDVREGRGFRVRLKPSRGAKGQVYVLIDLTGGSRTVPQTLVITGPGGECVRLPLPEIHDSVVQILTDEESEAVRLLRNPKSEIFAW